MHEPRTRREFLKQLSAGAAAMALSSAAIREEPPPQQARPNIVLFYIDDLDFDEIGPYDAHTFPCYTGAKERGLFRQNMNPWLAYFENPAVHTPHLDGLAREGVRFNRFYVTSTLCSPSRYALLTGRYACRSEGVRQQFPPGGPATILQHAHLGESEQSIARILKAAGYATGMVGKWHNFDWDGPYAGRVEGIPPDADPRDPDVAGPIRAAYDRGVQHIRAHHGFDYADRIYLQNKEALGIPKALQMHNLEWLVEGALDFIEDHRDEPFFLYFASPMPHGWVGSGDFLHADPCATPAGILDAPPKGMPPREDTARRAREAGATGRLMESTWLDDAVGAVLGKLETLGVAENTLVLFISDHQNRGKETLYEAARVPALMRWPARLPCGCEIDALCANIDVLPTVAEACGIPLPKGFEADGQSLLPLFNEAGPPEAWRDSLMLEIAHARAVVTPEWKYIALRYPPPLREEVERAEPGTYAWNGTATRFQKGNQWDREGDVYVPYGANKDFPGYFDADQLYNLREDPYEQKNLAADPAHEETLAQMKQRLRAHLIACPHTFGEFRA